jgi:hypothetical protein
MTTERQPGKSLRMTAGEDDCPGKREFDREEYIARDLLRQGFRGPDLTEKLKQILDKKKY